MMLLLAQAAATGAAANLNAWGIVSVLSMLVALALSSMAYIRQVSGKGGERQIEPTQIAAITNELKAQTVTLNKLDREMGETRAGVEAVNDKITAQGEQVDNAFKRINAISIESAQVRARLDDHLADHRGDRRNA